MPATVSVKFIQDLNTWDGLYAKGSTLAECPIAKAQQWADEGLVSIESALKQTATAPAPKKSEPSNTPSHAGANRTR